MPQLLSFTLGVLAFSTLAIGIPITPSAATIERRAEQLRAEGLSERDITNLLITQSPQDASNSATESAILSFITSHSRRDISGDLAPGALPAPDILPRDLATDEAKQNKATKQLIIEFMKKVMNAKGHVGKRDAEDSSGYEGMESMVKRPKWVLRF